MKEMKLKQNMRKYIVWKKFTEKKLKPKSYILFHILKQKITEKIINFKW